MFFGTSALFVLSLLVTGGCAPPNTEYKFGLSTTSVTGTVIVEDGGPDKVQPIIVVLKNHDTFIPRTGQDGFENSSHPVFQQNFTHPTAHVQRVDASGQYVINMPVDVVSMDILFIAKDRLTRRVHFDRRVGIGRINYRAILPVISGWRSHFYTFLEPQLQELIVEDRYQLPERQQQFLDDWLDAQKQRMESGRAR